jgi:hypothetical protein
VARSSLTSPITLSRATHRHPHLSAPGGEPHHLWRNLGTATKKDTVNTALREVNARRRRLAALERMAEPYERGELDQAVAAWEHRKATGIEPEAPAA